MSKQYPNNLPEKVSFRLDNNPDHTAIGKPIKFWQHGLEVELYEPVKGMNKSDRIIVPREEIMQFI